MLHFKLAVPAAAIIASIAFAPPAEARKKSDETRIGAQCNQPAKRRGGLMGSIARTVAGNALGRAGVPSGVAGIAFPVASLMTDAIIARLNCKEQVQAATATNQATRGGVGTTSAWESDTRPGVTGSSTVIAQRPNGDGGTCMRVNDVVIVNGEETTVAKTMCRAPGAAGYTLQA